MRKPYTPTTEEIRTAYVLMRSTGRAKVLGDMLAEFDRWLNTERARIRAEAERRYPSDIPDRGLTYPTGAVREHSQAAFVAGWEAREAAGRAETTTDQEAISENERLRTNLWALQEQDERAELWREKVNRYHARLAAVEALLADGPDTWEGYDTRDIGHAFLADSVTDFTADLRAALETDTTKET